MQHAVYQAGTRAFSNMHDVLPVTIGLVHLLYLLQVLLALCSRLHTIQQLRKGLGNRLHAIKALTAPEGDKQRLIDQEIDTLHLQLRGAAQVEVLLAWFR